MLAVTCFYTLILLLYFRVVTTFFLFLFRGFSIAAYLVMYTYTAEVYPTRVRGIAQSIGGLASFIGAAVTPFIAQARDHNYYCKIFFLSFFIHSCVPLYFMHGHQLAGIIL